MKRVRIAIVIVFVALIGAIGWQVVKPNEPEPIYKGRTLTSWLKDWDAGPVTALTVGPSTLYSRDNPETAEAVRQMGTNAFPTLLRLLRAKDSALKFKAINLLGRVDERLVRRMDATYWNCAAIFGFKALGTNAQAAVPELVRIANQNISVVSRSGAVQSLGYIGPPAKQAVPEVMRWATNKDIVAIWALIRIDPEAAAKARMATGITNEITVQP
jgi:hypothetical protein